MKYTKMHGAGNDFIIINNIICVFLTKAVEPQFIVSCDDVQRVNNLNIDWTIANFIGWMINSRITWIAESDAIPNGNLRRLCVKCAIRISVEQDFID